MKFFEPNSKPVMPARYLLVSMLITVAPDILFMLTFAKTDAHQKRVLVAKQSGKQQVALHEWEKKVGKYKEGVHVSSLFESNTITVSLRKPTYILVKPVHCYGPVRLLKAEYTAKLLSLSWISSSLSPSTGFCKRSITSIYRLPAITIVTD